VAASIVASGFAEEAVLVAGSGSEAVCVGRRSVPELERVPVAVGAKVEVSSSESESAESASVGSGRAGLMRKGGLSMSPSGGGPGAAVAVLVVDEINDVLSTEREVREGATVGLAGG